ncbi:MAG: D-2-hydroxyacid dehydrogenase [Mariniblastus sp.]
MKIVVLDGHTLNPGDNSWDPVRKHGEVTIHERTSKNETVARSQDADILLTNKVVLDESIISQLPNLKYIGVTATGFNVVDVEFARSRNIPVTNVPEYSTQAVAQFVFASLLSFIHRPAEHNAAIQDGQWQASNNFSFWLSPSQELLGKTFGIIGLGKIGRATAKLATAFGMKVIAHSRTETDPLDSEGFRWLSVENVFAQSDFISLHCPQTPETTGFVNADLISKMKPNGILINTARGGLVNEQDLAAALNQKTIAGALLDVASTEPIDDGNPLLSATNCILTPHIAWTPIEARKRLMETVAENIENFLAGSPSNLVG